MDIILIATLFFFGWSAVFVDLMIWKFVSEHQKNFQIVVVFLGLILVLFGDIKLGRSKLLAINCSLLTIHSVMCIALNALMQRRLMPDIIRLTLDLFWCTIPSLLFCISLDQMFNIQERYNRILFIATCTHYILTYAPSIAFLLTNYNLYWMQDELYVLEYMPMLFGFIGVLFLIAMFKSIRRIQPPQKNPLIRMLKCYCYSRHHYRTDEMYHVSLLDIGAQRFGSRVANDIKRTFALLLVFPLIVVAYIPRHDLDYWHKLSKKMEIKRFDPYYFPLTLFTVQILTIPFMLIVICVIRCFGYLKAYMRSMLAGAIILTFTTLLQWMMAKQLAKNEIQTPRERTGELVIYNTLNCDMTIKIPVISSFDFEIDRLNFKHIRNFTFQGELKTAYSYTCGDIEKDNQYLRLYEKNFAAYYFKRNADLSGFKDNLLRHLENKPKIRVLANLNKYKNIKINLKCPRESFVLAANSVEQTTIRSGLCELTYLENQIIQFNFHPRAVYVIIMYESDGGDITTNIVCVISPENIESEYLFCHLIFVEIGRALFNIFGLSWMYLEAPTRFKLFFVHYFRQLQIFGDMFVYVFVDVLLQAEYRALKHSLIMGLTCFGLACFIVLTMFHTSPNLDEDSDEYSDDEYIEQIQIRRSEQPQRVSLAPENRPRTSVRRSVHAVNQPQARSDVQPPQLQARRSVPDSQQQQLQTRRSVHVEEPQTQQTRRSLRTESQRRLQSRKPRPSTDFL